ncbi:hypothetical protein BU24DRAFT_441829 [Aaosphaeria arxii CBS 175.79]|uniref:Saponin hydrolase n=1 Tax=Aaosphaeria arxii CBS 175.79 TaxID=1450172 RepID=A0A6A5XM02_9PLEO|nr:uncharacterized protein BU24DRAFT_441829 [Aaosphaeria arxii CBS 175.79]KAF2014275.1 hypothetical protein BU24DRAFT_441829 [Aaosphaeria arxii CBS 175.79]
MRSWLRGCSSSILAWRSAPFVATCEISRETFTNSAPPLEKIIVSELPLPPTSPSEDVGACSGTINPRRTGCISKTQELRNGNFLPNSRYIVATIHFAGAPAAPDPGSIYTGEQLIIIKTDGKLFPNGDPWKCITCGMPAENKQGSTAILEYPQAFKDGQRVLAGNNIIDGGYPLDSPKCTPNTTHIYPIRWGTSADNSGNGSSFRENRLHPDNVHMGFSAFTFTATEIGEFAFFSRLLFNPAPVLGLPLVPRYDLVNVTRLFDPTAPQRITVDGNQLKFNFSAVNIGELRGFSGSGDEITYVGFNRESGNTDLFAVKIRTGTVRRLTEHPGYTDPIDFSPDDKWMVILDTRGTDRVEFVSGMRHVPPLIDLVANKATTAVRNNGARRFFQPWLLDRSGDRGSYFGQKLNAGDNTPGSISDPQWNAQADPRWSWDQTQIAYYQALTVSPACGGMNPLPCPVSTAQGGRTYRIMLAKFPSRTPLKIREVSPVSDIIPWGVPVNPGDKNPTRPGPPPGNYVLKGISSGFANVTFKGDAATNVLTSVAVTYHQFSDDGLNFLEGSEDVNSTTLSVSKVKIDWHSNLTLSGQMQSTKVTSPEGFHVSIDLFDTVFEANGTLTTTVNGKVYKQPLNNA